MVGLWKRMDYGKTVNWLLEHSGNGQITPEQKEEKHMTVTVTSPNGGPVNLRKAASKAAALVDRILPGTDAELLESAGSWSKIRVAGRTGWMMTEFLVTDESAEPDETYCVTIFGLDQTQAQAICNNYPDRSTMEVSRG